MSNFENDYKNWHGFWSFIKSGIRIVACLGVVALGFTLEMFALLFLAAELVGVIEEMI